MRVCPITGSEEFKEFYVSSTNRIMTSDHRIILGNLDKIIFLDSGIVANRNAFNSAEINAFYGDDYQLNTSGTDEHVFYTNDGPISRSQVYFDWIKPFILEKFNSLIEIGCGEGKVLEKVKRTFPSKKVIGFDGSHKAVEIGRHNGLDLKQKIFSNNDVFPNADIFLLIGVVEHIEDPINFIKSILKNLNRGGRIILSIPIQDFEAYDIFFKDHIWHFTSNQFKLLLESCGLSVFHIDVYNKINHGFGLFVCEKQNNSLELVKGKSDLIKNNLLIWKKRFTRFNELTNNFENKKVVIFGASEIATLFLAYTNLYKLNIVACIDDTKGDGFEKHGIPVYPSSWLENNKVDVLLLTVNEKYHDMVRDKLKHLNLNIQSIY